MLQTDDQKAAADVVGDPAGLWAEFARIAETTRSDVPRSMAEAVLRHSAVQHVSLAALDPREGRAQVLAAVGTDVIMPGSTVALEQSTRLVATAAGKIWRSSDFAREPGFSRMVDQLAKAVGYRTGCAVPIMWGGQPVGAIVLSSTQKRRSWDALTADLSATAPMLAVALRLDRGLERSRLHVLVVHPDTLVGHGLARIVERGLNADVRLVHGHLDPQLRGSNGWADIVVAHAGSVQRPSAGLMVAVGHGAVTAVALAAADDPASQAAARTAGLTAVIGRHWAPEQIVATLAQAVTGTALPAGRPPSDPLPQLSRRERDLLHELETGLPYKRIAARLGLTSQTVRGYSKTLYGKLGAHSRGEAVYQARRQGLL